MAKTHPVGSDYPIRPDYLSLQPRGCQNPPPDGVIPPYTLSDGLSITQRGTYALLRDWIAGLPDAGPPRPGRRKAPRGR
jgi:hypothetical protein